MAEENQAQLVVAGYYIDTYYNDTEYLTLNQVQPDAVYDQEAFRRSAYKLFDANLLYTPWNKLFSRAYVDERGLRFPQTFWDDFPFVLSVIRDVERVAVTSKQYYHFMRARAESETAAYRSNMYDKREEEHGWMLDLYAHWGVQDEASMEMVAARYVERLVGCVENVTNPRCTLSKEESAGRSRKIIRRGTGAQVPEAGASPFRDDESDPASHQVEQRISHDAGKPRCVQGEIQQHQIVCHPKGQAVSGEHTGVAGGAFASVRDPGEDAGCAG